MYHEYFPEEMILLQKELRHWPMISEEAQRLGQNDIAKQLGIIAARLSIVLDGMYDVPDLCKMLTKVLYAKRTTTLYIPDASMKEVRIKESADTVVIEPTPNLPKPN